MTVNDCYNLCQGKNFTHERGSHLECTVQYNSERAHKKHVTLPPSVQYAIYIKYNFFSPENL